MSNLMLDLDDYVYSFGKMKYIPENIQAISSIEKEIAVDFNELWGVLENEYGYEFDFSKCNYFFITALKEVLFEPSEVKRIMIGFDYLEFMLRVLAIYFHTLKNGNSQPYSVPDNCYAIAEQIMLNIDKSSSEYNITETILFYDTAEMVVEKICSHFGYKTDDKEFDFCGIISLLKMIRNKTRGHGTINEHNSGMIWNFIVCIIFWVSKFLNVTEFCFDIKDDGIYCGYDGAVCNIASYIVAENNMPCIPMRSSSKKDFTKSEYMNFFSGKYIIPDFVKRTEQG